MGKLDTILWRFNIFPGHEFCRLQMKDSNWYLEGTAVFTHEQRPCKLDYAVICDAAWHTQFATVEGWLGQTRINVHVRTDANHHWWLNGDEVPEIAGCSDLDLNFSPSTNTIPIRRLNLAIGESAEIRAAWLRFPGFNLEPLDQRYTRLDEAAIRYESGSGRFVADLHINQSGFVIDYPGIWIVEATSTDQ